MINFYSHEDMADFTYDDDDCDDEEGNSEDTVILV